MCLKEEVLYHSTTQVNKKMELCISGQFQCINNGVMCYCTTLMYKMELCIIAQPQCINNGIMHHSTTPVYVSLSHIVFFWHPYYRCTQSEACARRSSLDLPSEIGHYLGPESATTDSDSAVTDIATNEKTTGMEEPSLYMDDLHDHDGGWPIYLGMLRRKY